MRTGQRVAILIIASTFGSAAVMAAQLPTAEEVQGIQNLCGAGNIQAEALKGSVDAAIANWRYSSATVDIEAAKKNLAAALAQVRNDTSLAPVYKLYVDCVTNALAQYLATTPEAARSLSADQRQSLVDELRDNNSRIASLEAGLASHAAQYGPQENLISEQEQAIARGEGTPDSRARAEAAIDRAKAAISEAHDVDLRAKEFIGRAQQRNREIEALLAEH